MRFSSGHQIVISAVHRRRMGRPQFRPTWIVARSGWCWERNLSTEAPAMWSMQSRPPLIFVACSSACLASRPLSSCRFWVDRSRSHTKSTGFFQIVNHTKPLGKTLHSSLLPLLFSKLANAATVHVRRYLQHNGSTTMRLPCMCSC